MTVPGDTSTDEAERESEVDRIVFFSDAVFAIAITLLALEIRLPQALGAPGALQEALLGLWPQFLSFLISFWLVGTYWIAHHRVFRCISGYDRRLLFINLLFLMWIALLPFSSSMLGEYGDLRITAIVYAAHVGLAGLSLCWLWWHASRDSRLVEASRMSEREWRYNELGPSVPLVFLLSIGISFISVTIAEGLWFLALLIRPVLLKIPDYRSR